MTYRESVRNRKWLAGALCACSAVLVFDAALPAASPRTEYVVDFRAEHSLKPVFDAGLRPVLVSHLESDKCWVQNCRAVFLFPGGGKIPIDAEYVFFSVHADDNISSLEANASSSSVEIAYAQARAAFAGMGEPMDRLQQGLDRMRAAPGADVRSLLGFRRLIGSTDVRVGFLPGPYVEGIIEKPLRYMVTVIWHDTERSVPLRDSAIIPPKGYESLSMSPDEPHPQQPHYNVAAQVSSRWETDNQSPVGMEAHTLHLWPIAAGTVILLAMLIWAQVRRAHARRE